MELGISHLDGFIEECTTSSDVKSVRVLDLDVDSIQVLVPRERWGHFDGNILLFIDHIKQRVIFCLDDFTCFACGCNSIGYVTCRDSVNCVGSCLEIVRFNKLL